MLNRWIKVLKTYKFLMIFTVGVIATGHFFGNYFLIQGEKTQKQRLMDVAIMAAASVNKEKLTDLKDNISDEQNQNFIELNEQFSSIGEKTKNLGIRWIYSMFVIDGKIYFSFDSTIPGSSDYEPPGGEYKKPPKELSQLIKNKRPIVTDHYSDEYGSYVSAFVPILNEETGDLIAIIGSDMEYSEYSRQVNKNLLFPLITTFLAVILVFLTSAYLLRLKKSRENIEDALNRAQHEKAKAELLISDVSEPIAVLDAEGCLTYVNKAVEEVLGCRRDQLLGKSVFEILVIPEDKGNMLNLIKNVHDRLMIKKKKVMFSSLDSGIDLVCTISGKKLSVMLTLSPIIISEKVVGMIGVLNDITHIVKVDRMKNDFISLASHQLRTPISKMRWMIEMLLDDNSAPISSSQKDLMNKLYDTNQRLIQLVNSLLNISRIESGRIAINPTPVDLVSSVKAILSNHQFMFNEKDQQLSFESDKIPEINIDFKLVGEVYKNIISNASKYSPKGAKIIIKIYIENQKVITEISDNGYGIPAKSQSHLFQKFYRADNTAQIDPDGSGLGLYLAKAIVESSGGKMWFKSVENKGSTFWFSLPLKGSRAKEGSVSIESEK